MTFRVGLVGTGAISKFHVQGLRRLADVEIVGVTDLHLERAEGFAAEHGLKAFPSLVSLREAGAGVIHVLTPPAAHAAVTLEAIALGCDVFVEKPLATSVEDCDRIAQAALDSGRRVCVGHSLLYDPFVRRALDLVRDGVIGEVLTFDYHRCMNQQSYPASGLSAEHGRGGYPFRDIGIHALYLAEAFVGPIVDLDAWPTATGRGDVNLWVDEWRVMARCQRGTAQIQLSWNVRPQQNLCIIQGTRGVIRVDVFGMSVTSRRQRGMPEHASRIINATGEGFGIAAQAAGNVFRVAGKRLWQFHGVQALIAEFYDRLRQGGEPPVTPAEARRVLYWTEHVARQADVLKDAWLTEATARRVGATTLVTGGGGFIGRQLVERLLQEGRKVRLLLRRPPAHELSVHPNVEVVLGDLGDAAVVTRAVDGIQTVFHIGAAMRGSGPEFERSTVTGTRNVVNACLESGVQQLVYMSSLAVLDTDAGQGGEVITESSALEQRPEERGAYTRTKLDAERIVLDAVRDRNLPAVLFRPGEVVGPEKPLLTPGVAQRAGRNLVVIGNGGVRLPLVHVSDVVDALMAAAERGIKDGTIIQLVEDVAVTQNDIIEHYLATTGEKRRVIRIPLPAVLALARVMEVLTTKLFGRALIGPRRIRAATASRRFDVSRAQTLLDWKPRHGVASSLARDGVDQGVGGSQPVAEREAGRAASV